MPLFLWTRLQYIDEIFLLWTHSEEKIKDFLARLNDFYPNLKFTHKQSHKQLNFHDVMVKLNGEKFSTGLFYIKTDGHK